MNEEQSKRLRYLVSGPWIPPTFAQELFGFDPLKSQWLEPFEHWWRQGRRREDPHRDGNLHRYQFEVWLKNFGFLPVRWAALRLGMNEESFRAVVEGVRVDRGSPLLGELSRPDDLVEEQKTKRIYKLFPRLSNRIFSDHDDMCSELHASIHESLNIKPSPMFCAASVALRDNPADFAYTFDAVTLEPIGIRYQAWMDFGKPVHLAPDVVSIVFYERNRDTLSQYLLGTPFRLSDAQRKTLEAG